MTFRILGHCSYSLDSRKQGRWTRMDSRHGARKVFQETRTLLPRETRYTIISVTPIHGIACVQIVLCYVYLHSCQGQRYNSLYQQQGQKCARVRPVTCIINCILAHETWTSPPALTPNSIFDNKNKAKAKFGVSTVYNRLSSSTNDPTPKPR